MIKNDPVWVIISHTTKNVALRRERSKSTPPMIGKLPDF
jgi:hypothetical protein